MGGTSSTKYGEFSLIYIPYVSLWLLHTPHTRQLHTSGFLYSPHVLPCMPLSKTLSIHTTSSIPMHPHNCYLRWLSASIKAILYTHLHRFLTYKNLYWVFVLANMIQYLYLQYILFVMQYISSFSLSDSTPTKLSPPPHFSTDSILSAIWVIITTLSARNINHTQPPYVSNTILMYPRFFWNRDSHLLVVSVWWLKRL